MLHHPKILLLCNEAAESRKWEDLFREHAVLRAIGSLAELEKILCSETYDALLCAWSLQQQSWTDVLRKANQLCPDLPVIVYSGTGGEREWVRVLEAGAFDLLVAPYQRRTVLPVLEQAMATSEARRFHHSGSFLKAKAG